MTQPVPDEMAPAQVLAAEAPRVALRAPDGSIVNISEDQLGAAVARGYAPLEGQELQRAQDASEAEALGAAGQGVAGVRGLMRGLAPGVYDPAVIESTRLLQGDDAAEMARRSLNASSAAFPSTDAAAGLAGMLTPTAATRAIGAVGGLAGRVAGKIAPEAASVGGRILNEGIRASASGAIEGGIYGAGGAASEMALSEDQLGDPETVAQRLFAGAGKGGLLGGVLGGVIGAGGAALGEAAGSVSEGLARRAKPTFAEEPALGGETAAMRAEDIADWDARFAASEAAKAKPEGVATSKPEASVDSMAARYINRIGDAETRAAAQAQYEARKALGTVDDALDATNRRATAAGDEFLQSQQATRKAFFGDSKAKKLAEIIDVPDPERGLGAMFTMRDYLRKGVDWLDQTVQGDGRIAIRKVAEGIDAFDAKMAGTAKLGAGNIDNLRAGYVLMDDLKRTIGRNSGMGRESLSGVQEEMQKLYEAVRLHLEDASLYGKGAEAQKAMNLATTEMLQRSKGARAAFIDATESVGGEMVLRADPKKMKNFLSGAIDSGLDLDRESVERYIAGHEAQIAAARAHWPLSASESAGLAKGEAAIAKFRAEMKRAETEARVAVSAKKKLEEEMGRAIGGTIGMIADVFSSPMRTAQRLGDIHRAAKRAGDAIDSGLDGFFAGRAAPTAAPPMAREEAVKIGQEASRVAAQPSLMLERIGRAFAGISEAAPKIGTYLGSTATRNLAFLSSKAPKSAVPMATLTPQFSQPRFSDSDVASFARTYRAWEKPETVLEDMARGAITREGVEVLRECYPSMYADVQKRALEKLADLKHPLSYERRIQLGLLLSVPADPTLDASFVTTMQAAKKTSVPGGGQGGAAQPAAGTSGRQGRPIVGPGYQTESERIAGR